MNSDLKDILSNSNKDIDNQKLMDYLSQQISAADSHDLEKSMAEDAFMNDAIEGLQKLRKQKNLPLYLEELNGGLQKQLAKSKKRKEKRRIKNQVYTYFAVLLVLLLMIICFNLLWKNSKSKKTVNKTATVQTTNILNGY